MNKQLLKKYNTKDSLIVISGYPKRKEKYSQGVCAVSSFTKNTLEALSEVNPDRKVVVLTMVIDKEEIYEEDGMLIVRCFKRNAPLSYFSLIKNIMAFNKISAVMVEFEFASFGNTLMTGLLGPVVWAMKVMGKNITIVSHQVVSNIADLSGHIGLSKNNPITKGLNLSLKLFYKFICFPATKVVVLEEEFKDRLSKLINSEKIVVIPHGIDTEIAFSNKKDLRKKYGIGKDEFVVMYFGYITWYKGVDFIIEALSNVKKINGRKIRLVIAGGPSFTQGEKVHYQRFLNKVNKALSASKNTITTGFVKEEDINSVFSMADLSVLPYRTFMSSSGPLSLAISHKKPFLLSSNLGDLTRSKDVKLAMEKAGLSKSDVTFKLTKKDLVSTIKNAMSSETNKKLVKLSEILNGERSFISIANKYNAILSEEKRVNSFILFPKVVVEKVKLFLL